MRTIFWMLSIAGLALPACGLLSTPNKSLAQVDDLVSCIERLHVDAELSRERSDKAMSALQTMANPGFQGDAVMAHAQLQRDLELAEKQAKDLRFGVERMKRAAEPVFARWGKDLEAMQSPEIKQRSQARFAETKLRYDAIVAAVDPTLAGYDRFTRTLRDHTLYLGHDFNAGALAALDGEVKKLATASRELSAGFAQCMKTTRAYVDTSALPMRVEAARPAPQ